MAGITSVPVEQIASTFNADYIDLISSRLGTRVLSATDEFFCAATNLQTPTPPIHKPNTFTPAGAWYDGWETRRHNPAPFDAVVFRLGVRAARLAGAEIDTGFFSGNQAPEIAVQACSRPSGGDEAEQDAAVAAPGFDGWEDIVPRQPCGPACRQAWALPSMTAQSYTHVRLQMFPDGGIARFRLYGAAVASFAGLDPAARLDLAAVHAGGVATRCSDQHFGVKDNLLLPGRGVDMGDGWETKRTRAPGHTDWVVVRLGAPAASVDAVVVDTAHFKGNFPREVAVYAAEGEPEPEPESGRWVRIVAPAKCQAHFEHVFEGQALAGVHGLVVRWVKMVIFPDGGVKRLRVWGTRVVE